MREELMIKAKETASVDELMELAKASNIEITEETAKDIFAKFHSEGELSDDELDNVAGGACEADYTGPAFVPGDVVEVGYSNCCKNPNCGYRYLEIIGSSLNQKYEEEGEYIYEAKCTYCGWQRYITTAELVGTAK